MHGPGGVDRVEHPGYYEPDKDAMIEKLEEARTLLGKIDILLEESCSGGKHATGCHVDFIKESISKEFDRVWKILSPVSSILKNLIRQLESDDWRDKDRVFHYANDITIGCVEVYKGKDIKTTGEVQRVNCYNCIKTLDELNLL